MSNLDESPFVQAFEANPEGLIIHDGQQVLFANTALAQLLGTTREDMEGKPLERFVAPENADAVKERSRIHDESAYEGLGLHADGTRIPLVVRGKKIVVDGKPLRLAALHPASMDDDVLEQLRKDIVAREELRHLKETSEFKTQILNTTAHELNTPLTPVRLQLHLIKSGALGPVSDRHSKALRVIDRNVERLSFLVNDILDVARLESGRLQVNREPTRLDRLLAEAVESFAETARRVGVSLAVPAESRLIVDVDAERMNQVIFNLVSNALKFTPSGGAVTVQASQGDGMAVLDVKDTGPGLTQEQIGLLFQPFGRVHDTTASTIPGTGLGLYISKGILDSHDGRIEAISDGPGKGSTFRIHMPLSQAEPIAPRAQSAPTARADPLAQRLRELI